MAICFCRAQFERLLFFSDKTLTIRTVARSTLIRTAAALRADELTLALRRWLVRSGRPPRLLAVEMHETPERNEAQLRQQLEWAARHF
jgi:hypothetical protein